MSSKTSTFLWVLLTNICVFGLTLAITYAATKSAFEEDTPAVAAAAAAPAPLQCTDAEPQAPRDISAGAQGSNAPQVATIAWDDISKLVHVNTHFHLGAEHKRNGEYDIAGTPSTVSSATPGYKCDTSGLTPSQRSSYNFQYCKEVEVGETYEMHWVNSNNGVRLGGGLGGAFARGQNPSVAVIGQVVVVVNDPSLAHDNYAYTPLGSLTSSSVRSYMGSTTGGSYNNEVCSPYTVSWHVDPQCRLIHAESFDLMCKELKNNNAEVDVHPHSSREILNPAFVVPASHVTN